MLQACHTCAYGCDRTPRSCHSSLMEGGWDMLRVQNWDNVRGCVYAAAVYSIQDTVCKRALLQPCSDLCLSGLQQLKRAPRCKIALPQDGTGPSI